MNFNAKIEPKFFQITLNYLEFRHFHMISEHFKKSSETRFCTKRHLTKITHCEQILIAKVSDKCPLRFSLCREDKSNYGVNDYQNWREIQKWMVNFSLDFFSILSSLSSTLVQVLVAAGGKWTSY